MKDKLVRDINAKWKDFRINNYKNLNESTGNYIRGLFSDLYASLKEIPDAGKNITQLDLNILEKSIKTTENAFKRILKGKGLINW